MKLKMNINRMLLLSLIYLTFELTTSNTHTDKIVAVSGLTPTIDGSIEPSEWNDAAMIAISVASTANATVNVKQDGTNLYIGFDIPDVTSNASDSCVVILDVDHDQNTSLQTDDKWFASSRQDGETEYNVTAGGWFPTKISGWTAKAGSTASGWQLEYNITYSKLGIISGTNKTIGIAFIVIDRDVEKGWYIWPSTASILKPSTWADMTSNGYDWAQRVSPWSTLLLPLITLFVVAIAVLVVARVAHKRKIRKEIH